MVVNNVIVILLWQLYIFQIEYVYYIIYVLCTLVYYVHCTCLYVVNDVCQSWWAIFLPDILMAP